MQISFLGEKVEINDARSNYIAIRRMLEVRKKEADSEFWDKHDQYDTPEMMIQGLNYMVNQKLKLATNDVIGFLQEKGVYEFSDSMFWENYVCPMGVTDPWEESIDSILEKCQQIDGQNQAAHEYREMRKQTRGRWVGGGFGMEGAIKGSIQAGALNLGSGMVHGAVNGFGNAISNGIAKSEKKALMNDFKTTCDLSFGLDKMMDALVYAAGKATQDYGISVEYPSEDEQKRASAILSSINKGVVPEDKRIEQIVRAWNYDPYSLNLYSTILKSGLGKMSDIAEMMDTVGVDAKPIQKIILDEFLEKLDYKNLDEEQTKTAKAALTSLCEDFGYDLKSLKDEDLCEAFEKLDEKLLYYEEEPIMSYLRKVSVDSLEEEEAGELLEKIRKDCGQYHFDFKKLEKEHKSIYKYVKALEKHLKDIDRRCKTVEGVLMETREEAAQYRRDLEIYEKLIQYRDIVSEEGYLAVKEDFEVAAFKSEKFRESLSERLEKEREARDWQGRLSEIQYRIQKNMEEDKNKRLFIRDLANDFSRIVGKAIGRIGSLYKQEGGEKPYLYFDAGKKEEHTPGLLVTNYYAYLYEGGNKPDMPVSVKAFRLNNPISVNFYTDGIGMESKEGRATVSLPFMFEDLEKYAEAICQALAILQCAYYNDASNEAYEKMPKQGKTDDSAVKEKQERERKEILEKFGSVKEADMETIKKLRVYVYTEDIDYELKRKYLQQIQRRLDETQIREIEELTADYEKLGEEELLKLSKELSEKYPSRLTEKIIGSVDQLYQEKKEARIELEIKEFVGNVKEKSRKELLELNELITNEYKDYSVTKKYSQEILGEIEGREKEQLQKCMVGYETMDRDQLKELVKTIVSIEHLPGNKEVFAEKVGLIEGLLKDMDVQYALSRIGKPDGKSFLKMENDLQSLKEMDLVNSARKEVVALYEGSMKKGLDAEIKLLTKSVRDYCSSNAVLMDGIFLPGGVNFDKARDLAFQRYELGPMEDIVFMHFTATLVSETMFLITNKAIYFKGDVKKRVCLQDVKDFTITKNLLSCTLMCNLTNGRSEKVSYKPSGKQHTQICALLCFVIRAVLDSKYLYGEEGPAITEKQEEAVSIPSANSEEAIPSEESKAVESSATPDDSAGKEVMSTPGGNGEKTMSLEEKLESLFGKYKNMASFRYTPKLKAGIKIPDDEKIFLAHDDTIFQSGKEGFAVSAKGFYCKRMFESVTCFTPMEELKTAKSLGWEDACLKMDGKVLMFCTSKERQSLKKDVEELIEYLRQS